jgi:hypothetical protein
MKNLNVRLDEVRDKGILDYLTGKGNISQYIRDLIVKDMSKGPGVSATILSKIEQLDNRIIELKHAIDSLRG